MTSPVPGQKLEQVREPVLEPVQGRERVPVLELVQVLEQVQVQESVKVPEPVPELALQAFRLQAQVPAQRLEQALPRPAQALQREQAQALAREQAQRPPEPPAPLLVRCCYRTNRRRNRRSGRWTGRWHRLIVSWYSSFKKSSCLRQPMEIHHGHAAGCARCLSACRRGPVSDVVMRAGNASPVQAHRTA